MQALLSKFTRIRLGFVVTMRCCWRSSMLPSVPGKAGHRSPIGQPRIDEIRSSCGLCTRAPRQICTRPLLNSFSLPSPSAHLPDESWSTRPRRLTDPGPDLAASIGSAKSLSFSQRWFSIAEGSRWVSLAFIDISDWIPNFCFSGCLCALTHRGSVTKDFQVWTWLMGGGLSRRGRGWLAVKMGIFSESSRQVRTFQFQACVPRIPPRI